MVFFVCTSMFGVTSTIFMFFGKIFTFFILAKFVITSEYIYLIFTHNCYEPPYPQFTQLCINPLTHNCLWTLSPTVHTIVHTPSYPPFAYIPVYEPLTYSSHKCEKTLSPTLFTNTCSWTLPPSFSTHNCSWTLPPYCTNKYSLTLPHIFELSPVPIHAS